MREHPGLFFTARRVLTTCLSWRVQRFRDACRPTAKPLWLLWNNGAPERIRTSDPQIRSLVVYPAELRARAREEQEGAT